MHSNTRLNDHKRSQTCGFGSEASFETTHMRMLGPLHSALKQFWIYDIII